MLGKRHREDFFTRINDHCEYEFGLCSEVSKQDDKWHVKVHNTTLNTVGPVQCPSLLSLNSVCKYLVEARGTQDLGVYEIKRLCDFLDYWYRKLQVDCPSYFAQLCKDSEKELEKMVMKNNMKERDSTVNLS